MKYSWASYLFVFFLLTADSFSQVTNTPVRQYQVSYGSELQRGQRGAPPPIRKDGLEEIVTGVYRAAGCEIEATLPRQTKTGDPIVLKVRVSNNNYFDVLRDAFGGISELRIIIVDEKLMNEPFHSGASGSDQKFSNILDLDGSMSREILPAGKSVSFEIELTKDRTFQPGYYFLSTGIRISGDNLARSGQLQISRLEFEVVAKRMLQEPNGNDGR